MACCADHPSRILEQMHNLRLLLLILTPLSTGCSSDDEPGNSGSKQGNTSPQRSESYALQPASASSRYQGPIDLESTRPIHDFDISSPMSEAELEKFSMLMLQKVRADPRNAIALMSQWEGSSPEGLRDFLFEEIVKIASPESLRSLADDVLTAGNASPSSRGNAVSFLKGIAFQGKEMEVLSELRTFFSSNPGQNYISQFFESVSPSRSSEILEDLPEFGIHGRNAVDAKRAIAFGLRIVDPKLALEIASGINSSYTGGFYGELFREWMFRDPAAAKVELQQLEPDQLRAALSSQGLVNLVSKDQELIDLAITKIPLTDSHTPIFQSLVTQLEQDEAFQMLQGFPPSNARGKLVEAALVGTSPESAHEMESILSALPEGLRQEASNALITKLAANSTEEALDHIHGISDSDLRSTLFQSVLGSTSMRSAEVAAKLFDEQSSSLSQPDDRSRMATTIAGNWAIYDIHSAFDWTTNLPPAERTGPASAVFDVWAKNDPLAFSEWLGDQPPGAMRDVGIRALVSELEASSPESVDAWRTMLSDGHQDRDSNTGP